MVQRFCLYCDREGDEVKGCWRETELVGGTGPGYCQVFV